MPIQWIEKDTPLRIFYDGREGSPVQLFRAKQAQTYTPLPVNYYRAIHQTGIPVEIRVDGLVMATASVESLKPVSDFGYTHNTVRFVCSGPGDYVVRINGAFALFLFMDEAPQTPDRIGKRPVISADTLHEAESDGERTKILQGIIDDAERLATGAVVQLPTGSFNVGTIEMRSGVYLHVPEDAVLQGSPDRSLYPADSTAKGLSIGRCRLIHFLGVSDAGIFGRGAIDGNGFRMRQDAQRKGTLTKRVTSNLVRINRCADIHIEDVLLRDSEFWNTHILDSENVSFRNIKLINEIPPRHWDAANPDFFWNNADGINPDATHNMKVDGLFAYCGDDCLPVKNTGNARDPERTTSNISFRRCTLISETTVTKIGTETCSPAISNILFENLLLLDGGSPFGIIVRDGATVRDVAIRGMRALRMAGAVFLHTQPRTANQVHPAGYIQNLHFEDCHIEHAEGRDVPPVEIALQQENNLQNASARNLVIDGKPFSFGAMAKPAHP